jgi:hypothetical protein
MAKLSLSATEKLISCKIVKGPSTVSTVFARCDTSRTILSVVACIGAKFEFSVEF